VGRPKILRADTTRNLKAEGQEGIWEWMLLKKAKWLSNLNNRRWALSGIPEQEV
jgi:hypothetical protein